MECWPFPTLVFQCLAAGAAVKAATDNHQKNEQHEDTREIATTITAKDT